MRRVRWVPCLLGVISLGVGLQTFGCLPLDYTEKDEAGGGGQSGNGGSGGSPVVPGCVPSVNPGVAVDGSCGVFVGTLTAGDTQDGTKEAPFQVLSDAVEAANKREKGKRNVYLCGQEYTGALALPAGVRLYGGFDCSTGETDWHYKESFRATLSAPAGQIPLTILGEGDESALEDVNVVAEPAFEAGGSSIAVMAIAVEVSFVRCNIEAFAAKDAAPRPNFEDPPSPARAGNPGNAACSASVVLGGAEQQSTCDAGPVSAGGGGGAGNPSSGSSGGLGTPGDAASGAGEGAGPCSKGGDGGVGDSGTPGAGAQNPGRLSGGTGYVGETGAEGGVGGVGKGGGGGGGSRGGVGANRCPTSATSAGASGGSGGPGGCGGEGGPGGQAGGSSIAIISLDSTLRFDAVILRSRDAGKGGTGGRGQEGGEGGVGGAGGSKPASATLLSTGCAGGRGGKGGSGGDGGSGAGGHSLGIAFTGAEPSLQGATVETGKLGAGGVAINPDYMDGKGIDGRKAPMLKFD